MKQKEIAKEIGYSSCTIQRYRHDIKMQSRYKQNKPRGPQKTSKELANVT